MLAHTDTTDITKGCAWAARLEVEIDAALTGAQLPVRYIGEAQVRDFAERGYTGRRLIEDHNLEVQTSALGELLAHTRAHIERGTTLDTATMHTEGNLTDVLVITVPEVAKYSSLIGALNAHGGSSVGRYNTYYLQVGHLDEVLAGAKLLISSLNIKDVRLLVVDAADKATMSHWKERLEGTVFMRGVGLTLVGPATAPKRARLLK